MELKEFVSESLKQILEGIHDAQSQENGLAINATAKDASFGGNLIVTGVGTFSRVDFDVCVAADYGSEGKANLKIWGVGIEGGGEVKTTYANRIAFSVPVRLPDGDTQRQDAEDRRWREFIDSSQSGFVPT